MNIIGRPPVPKKIRELVCSMAAMSPLWRAPRIHGELQKLGIAISERTVSRILRSIRRPVRHQNLPRRVKVVFALCCITDAACVTGNLITFALMG
jgi:hypothetical protein